MADSPKSRNHTGTLTEKEAGEAWEMVKDLPASDAPAALGLFSVVTLWKALARERVSTQTVDCIRLKIIQRKGKL